MRKKMLMELKPLKVMNRHIADAKKTEISLSPLEKQRGEPGKYRMFRQQNYQEIRDKHVVVHGGAFAGELLADLLEKDLMDLPVESAENGESPTEIAA